jgi:hypothetical protein
MLSSVDLDDKPLLKADEVEDVVEIGVLPSELAVCKLAT